MTEKQIKEKYNEAQKYFGNKQYEEAVSIFEELAGLGNAEAQFMMGAVLFRILFLLRRRRRTGLFKCG